MDPEVHLHSSPLRLRTASAQEFNQLPAHVYPANATRHPDGQVSIAGVALSRIAEEYGTPAFVLDEEDFRGRCARLAAAFGSGERVHYASKAFISRSVCRWVAEEGLALDVASLGELQVALAADFPAERITVHGNNKSREFVQTAVAAGVELIVIDSFQEIALLSEVASQLGRTQDVLVRVTPGVHVETHEFIATSHEDQKFGFSLASGAAQRAALACVNARAVTLRGLHCHVGSQVFDADGFVVAAERLLTLWAGLVQQVDASRAAFLNILDLGGGYGIAYVADQEALDVEAVASDMLERVAEAAYALGVARPTVNVEPGRALIGPSMVTVYRVGTVKDVETSEKTVRRYISVDGGMSDNIRPALYQAEYDVRIANRELSGALVPCRIVGSHCESGDILVNDIPLPDDVRPGDVLVIAATGAYCYAMSSRYNMMLRPPVISVRQGQAQVMIRRETIDDVLMLEGSA